MYTLILISLFAIPCVAVAQRSNDSAPVVKTAHGMIEGVDDAGIRVFKGIPFAQPPIGDRRWQAPQPVQSWEGIRSAKQFSPRPMQRPIFGDMNFRSDGMSEDCLYLNVWTPAKTKDERLPVLVYFYGGGFVAGDGSEPRYDGESMAREGIVALTVNYRLNVFGFFAHPELTSASPHRSSSNYGYLDQTAALRWVQENIAAFGGDPNNVTIAGESAGSISVSAQMASPLAKDLMTRAIGESGSLLGALPPIPLAEAERRGVEFAESVGAASLAELRAMSAEELLEATVDRDIPYFSSTVDGYFFPKPPLEIYAAGQQAPVPLLLGWNSEEMNYQALLGKEEPTPQHYRAVVQSLYGEQADEVLKLYPGTTPAEIIQSATDLASDRFIGYSTWKWYDLHRQTSDQPVYRYYYRHPRPAMRPEMGDAVAGLAGGVVTGPETQENQAPPAWGAVHSAEIEYAMGNLPSNRVYDWQPEDYRVSDILQGYFVNFIKTGDPNGLGLPTWPPANQAEDVFPVMHIGVDTQLVPSAHRARYQLLDEINQSKD